MFSVSAFCETDFTIRFGEKKNQNGLCRNLIPFITLLGLVLGVQRMYGCGSAKSMR